MSNFELIEDYLTNRLGEQEKKLFEQQLASDPSLQANVDLQKQVIEGVRKARVMELKGMLSRVPVGGTMSNIITGKMVGAVVTAGFIGAGLYFYLKPAEQKNSSPNSGPPPVTRQSAESARKEKLDSVEKQISAHEQPAASPLREERVKANIDPKITATKSPISHSKIEVVDPSDELVNSKEKEVTTNEGQKSVITTYHIKVEIDDSHEKYNFHYQFSNNKLMLYGSFDKGLYEILEINGEHKTVFLFYSGNYYLLNEKQNNVTPLESIRDGVLLRKLKEYRGR
jgi:hypothetical protein